MASKTKRALDFSRFPEWFRPESGFRFTDGGGDRCMVVGEGGWRSAEAKPLMLGEHRIGNAYDLVFHEWTLILAYNYKGEWHLADAFAYGWDLDPTWSAFKPGWSEEGA